MSLRYRSTTCPKGHFWHHEALPSEAKQWPEGQICRSVPHTNDRFFFLHTFLCKSWNKVEFYLKIPHIFTSTILFWRHFMALLWRSLVTKLGEVHFNQFKAQGRTPGSEHQGQTSISNPDQNLGFTCLFSSGVQEIIGFGHLNLKFPLI